MGMILIKRTGKGSDDHISLNPRKVNEIKQFLIDMDVGGEGINN